MLPKAWMRAGKIAGEARVFGASLVKEGASLLKVADEIEDFIRRKGGRIGFPVQISVNGMAAHYTPFPEDKSIFSFGFNPSTYSPIFTFLHFFPS